MLNFVYFPISGILWFWHKATGFLFEPSSGISWVLAIVLLVVTIRILLFKPMLNQQRSAIKMQQLAPQMQAIKQKYKNDQQAQAMAMRQLQKETGVNPLAGCLPVLVQMPVFIGLFHVLRSFNRTGEGAAAVGQSGGMSVIDNWNTPNYLFQVEDVRSFLLARVFNAPLSASVGMDVKQYEAFTVPGTPADFSRMDIIYVAVPLIIISALATHFNARMSVNRTQARQASGLQARQEGVMGQQMDMMNKMMLWFFPIMILATGFLWHIGLLVYMVTNNIWTYFQQRYIFGKLDQEEAKELAEKKAAKREAQEKLAPKVGQKPINPKKGGKPLTDAAGNSSGVQQSGGEGSATSSHLPAAGSGKGQAGPASKPAVGQKPARSKKRKRKR
ncbi:membrane protein insertase YidC [Corynebacterium lactis]|uniref:Membrane protein insertase YidC n=1 Tax=Corynebacterium lactis RW2-5 TaxID=1408189 RepID=A0A0K2H324_9CORY|nr:membrane protein insertase YidC [Corynebacterium lactis]ALA68333.1 preprotein translocase subunit YidC [Corynebacterium lactis RW2-5]